MGAHQRKTAAEAPPVPIMGHWKKQREEGYEQILIWVPGPLAPNTKTSAGSTQLREALSKNDPFDHKATISGIIVLAILKSVCANVLGSLIQSLCDISVP